MGISIKIKKIFEENNIHYYAVYNYLKNFDQISYYIGLVHDDKKILFFENRDFKFPICSYDIDKIDFDKKDIKIHKLINLRVITNAAKAILSDSFPQDISWHS